MKPRKLATAKPPAILYMLDGNAAIDSLIDADLERLSERHTPVLVAVGYDVPTRNDVVARAYDYTPPVYPDGQRMPAPVVRGRLGGRAKIFLALLEEKVKPLVHSRTGTDSPEYLWGHSFGGLFAMHVLFKQPDAFDHYIVADPSAWWHEDATPILNQKGEAIDSSTAVRDMAEGLQAHSAQVHYETFPRYGHGDMIRTSLERALDIAGAP